MIVLIARLIGSAFDAHDVFKMRQTYALRNMYVTHIIVCTTVYSVLILLIWTVAMLPHGRNSTVCQRLALMYSAVCLSSLMVHEGSKVFLKVCMHALNMHIA